MAAQMLIFCDSDEPEKAFPPFMSGSGVLAILERLGPTGMIGSSSSLGSDVDGIPSLARPGSDGENEVVWTRSSGVNRV